MILWLPSGSSTFWAYLWGIETCYSGWDCHSRDKVLSLPMRNWNPYTHHHSYLHLLVLSLPMRNWNLCEACNSKYGRKSFEPTYEELKPYDGKTYDVFVIGFEPTYEELKLSPKWKINRQKFTFWAYLWGIETARIGRRKNKCCLFWAYLWGIETNLSLLFLQYEPLFWAYLWGIETNLDNRRP